MGETEIVVIAPVKKVIRNSSSRAMPGMLNSLYRSSSIQVLYNAAYGIMDSSGATKPIIPREQ